MSEGYNFLGVIPARGGSKSVPHKNVRELGGKPLIAYTILAAEGSRYLDRTIVSTEDTYIADAARHWGGEVPFMRPKELSSDTTPTWPVLKHATAWVERESGRQVDTVVLLQPTSPFRTAADIDGAIKLYLDQRADVVASAVPSPYIPYFSMVETLPGSPWALPSKSNVPFHQSRQRAPQTWGLNGAIYVVSRQVVFDCDNHYEAQRYGVYPMPEERSLDIDSEFHFEMAEWLMSRSTANHLV